MDTEAILGLITDVAAELISPRFRALTEGQISEKNPGDLVTVADQEAEAALTSALRAAYPGALVLGEEAVSANPGLLGALADAGHVFTLDPLDGTKNFVHGSPDHAVMAAELRSGEVTRAWIWQPQHRVAYVAERGGGAWRNGERLGRRRPSADPATWRGVTSRRGMVGHTFPGLHPLALTWVCCGVDYPRLIEAECEFILYARAHPWDHAPGSLLLSEVGAVLGTLSPDTPTSPPTPYSPTTVTDGPLLAAASAEVFSHVAALALAHS
ncbi:MAG: inositol monophosphatase family protein [Nocardioides sp.]